MKKTISVVLALALVLSFCGIFASAKGAVNLVQNDGVTVGYYNAAGVFTAGSPSLVMGPEDTQWPCDYSGDMIDGVAGSDEFADGCWGTFYFNGNEKFDNFDGVNGIMVVDLGKVYANIDAVEAHVYGIETAGITGPKSITVSASEDGTTYTELGKLNMVAGAADWATLNLSAAVNARYIKYNFEKNAGVFIFISELAVYGDGTVAGGSTGGNQGGNQGGTTTTTQTTPVFDGISADAWVKTEVSGANVNIVTENGKTVISGSTAGTWPWADATFATPITLSAGDVINYDVTFTSGSFSMRFNGQQGLENDSFHSLFEGADIEAGSFNLKPGTYTGTITYEQLAEMYGATDGVVTLEKVTVFSVDGAEITVNKLDVVKTVTVSGGDNLGDAGIYAIAGLALVALLGTAVVIKKRA